MITAGWTEDDDTDDYACFQCGETMTTPRGQGCWWCEPKDHPEPAELAQWQQTPEEEAQMIAKGMLYITTKLAEDLLLRRPAP